MALSTRSLGLEKILMGEEGQTREELARQRRARTVVVIGAAIGLIVIALAFVGYHMYDMNASADLKDKYESSYDAYMESLSQLDESLISVSNILNECHASVADAGVCQDLERLNAQALELSNSRIPKIYIHNKSGSDIRKAIRDIQDTQNLVDQTRKELLEALEPVAQSQVDKVKGSIDAAIKDAQNAISHAQSIIGGVEGQVQDPAVVDEARAAIQEARAQIEGINAVTGTDTAAYMAALNSLKQATETLRAKTNAVTYSHQLWEQEHLAFEEQTGEDANHGPGGPLEGWIHGDGGRRYHHGNDD